MQKLGEGRLKWVPVDSNKGYDLKKIKESIDQETNMVFIANPNNPTGTLLNGNSLAKFCEGCIKTNPSFL